MSQSCTDTIINMWNSMFPNNVITAADLKQPQLLISCLLLTFKRLDIDTEVVVKPPTDEERNENIHYYWDLIPIINITKIINYIMNSHNLQYEFTLSLLLQPTQQTIDIFAYLVNCMLHINVQMEELKPYEDEIIEQQEKISTMDQFNKDVIQRLNDHAMEKGKRVERMQKMEQVLILLEEELKSEKAALDAEIIEYKPIVLENNKVQKTIDQLTLQRDTILTDIDKCKSQIVLDAEDIKDQEKRMDQDIEDAEKLVNTQSNALMQKESRLKILQSVKHIFDSANDCLQEIMDIVEILKQSDKGDFDTDSEEGELKMLTTELSDLASQHCDLISARNEAKAIRQDAVEQRQLKRITADRVLKDLDKKLKEQKEKAQRDIPLIKRLEGEMIENEESEKLYQQMPAVIREKLIKQITLMSEELMEALTTLGENIKGKLL